MIQTAHTKSQKTHKKHTKNTQKTHKKHNLITNSHYFSLNITPPTPKDIIHSYF